MIKKAFKFKFIRYAIWWWFAAALDIFLMWLFTEKFWIYYVVSACMSFVIAFSLGYLYQKYITFQSYSKKHMKHWTMFLLFQLMWQWLYLFLLWLLAGTFWFYYIYVAIFWKWVVFVWNYVMNYLFNFK